MLDFDLLDDPAFIGFVKSPEYATYLILRRYVWRGGAKRVHFLDLQTLYEQERLLVSSVSHQKIAKRLRLKDVTRVSKHLTKLQKDGLIKRIRTGRQNVYVLGEWLDISEQKDGSKRVEWFYLDRKFGQNPDLAHQAKSELVQTPKQTWLGEPSLYKRNKNKENITVRNVNGFKTIDFENLPHPEIEAEADPPKTTRGRGDVSWFDRLRQLPDLEQDPDKAEYIAQDLILARFEDEQSLPAYRIIAAKVPEATIRQAISEIDQDGAREPVKAFMHRMKLFTERKSEKPKGDP